MQTTKVIVVPYNETWKSDFEEIEYARELMEDKMMYFVHQYLSSF